jgi:hypothetical protein
MGFKDKEFRREFCMFAALVVGLAALAFTALNFSHNLGYWPHGNIGLPSASQTQSSTGQNSPQIVPPEGSLMQWLLLALTGASVIAVGILYYLGRRHGGRATSDGVLAHLAGLDKRTQGLATSAALTRVTAILEERLDKLEKWVAIGIATKDELGALTQLVTLLDGLSETAVNLIPGYFEHDNRITLLEARIDEIIVPVSLERVVQFRVGCPRNTAKVS